MYNPKTMMPSQFIKDMNQIEAVSTTAYELAVSSIVQRKTSSFLDEFQSFAINFEKITNILELDDKVENKKCYLFGKIEALYELVEAVNQSFSDSESFVQLFNHYPLLMPFLREIDEAGTISGVQLRERLSIGLSSSFSNFIKRIRKFDLVAIRKYGNTNYYSLTAKGRSLLYEHNRIEEPSSRQISVEYIHRILINLTEELSKRNPDKLKIIEIPVSTKERQLLKREVDHLFAARNIYRKSFFGYMDELCGDVFQTEQSSELVPFESYDTFENELGEENSYV